MTRLHVYHRCLHMAGNTKHGPFVALPVMGSDSFLVKLCPECYEVVSGGGCVDVLVHRRKNKLRKLKRVSGVVGSMFFEVMTL